MPAWSRETSDGSRQNLPAPKTVKIILHYVVSNILLGQHKQSSAELLLTFVHLFVCLLKFHAHGQNGLGAIVELIDAASLV